MGSVAVLGAGGFIAGHLVNRLVSDGNEVVAVDVKPLKEWFQNSNSGKVKKIGNCDLRDRSFCRSALEGVTEVFQLACDMGGIKFIEENRATCMLSSLINANLLWVAHDLEVEKFFFASSACVYNADKQLLANAIGLKEEDAYPAAPEIGYGEEKLFSERMTLQFRTDFGFPSFTARLHNIYGSYGSYDGGREKSPAAITRKVIQAKLSGDHRIEIWGDGKQGRSYCYIDDCVEGILRLTDSDFPGPINLGSSELVSINHLVDVAEEIAGVKLQRSYDLSAPQGVRGRSSDNTLIREVLDWEPSTPLHVGMERLYRWIYDQMVK